MSYQSPPLAIRDKTITNEHMREVINHSTHTHLLNTIKSILTQALKNFGRREFMARKTLTTCISETL